MIRSTFSTLRGLGLALLLGAGVAQAQIGLPAGQAQLYPQVVSATCHYPLDTVTVRVAYATVKLRSAYAGKSFQVQGNDAVTFDVPWDSSGCKADTTALTNFCNAHGCSPTQGIKLYDQVGSNDAPAFGSNPGFTISAVNGLPAFFTEVSPSSVDYQSGTATTLPSNFTIFAVQKFGNPGSAQYVLANQTSSWEFGWSQASAGTECAATQLYARSAASCTSSVVATTSASGISDTSWHIEEMHYNASPTIFEDGSSKTLSVNDYVAPSGSAAKTNIGAGYNGSSLYSQFGGSIAAIVIADTALSTGDSATVRTALKSYYATP